MSRAVRWTVADLEGLPDDGTRYEIIDGELHVSKQPDWRHQFVCGRLFKALDLWDDQTGAGFAIPAPGVIFSDEDAVAPDVVWISKVRLAGATDDQGHLRTAPDLVIEVLSPGFTNERRDRQTKLKLYSIRGASEYWLVDWRQRQVEVYRREEAMLRLVETLREADTLSSPLLPGFRLPVAQLFADGS